MFGDFLILDNAGSPATPVARLPLGDTGGRNEEWLRDRLFQHPSLLPIGALDAAYGPLLPLCRELRTEAGPIDVCYINPAGRMTLVECKLWRNPEARRKVVAQILDYARALVHWSYSDLQRQVSVAMGRQGNIPFELARSVSPGLVEQQFVDSVTRNLRGGRFLLVVAGDGIREDITGLTELINRNSALGFSFGLVELALYDLGDQRFVVQPRVPVRSQVIERNVMVLPGGDILVDTHTRAVEPELETRDEEGAHGDSKQTAYRQWWAPIVAMRFDDPDQDPPRVHWPNHVRVQLPGPKIWITAYRNDATRGSSGVFIAGREQERERVLGLLEPLDELAGLLPESTSVRNGTAAGKRSLYTERANSSFNSVDECREWLMASLNQYVNVLRPRLKQIMSAPGVEKATRNFRDGGSFSLAAISSFVDAAVVGN